MRNTNGRGLLALAIVVLLAVLIGLAMLWLNRQPKVTPAGSTGSLQGQLSPRTDPPH